MNSTADQLRARNLRTVGALAALFFLPVLASFWIYYFTDWRPAGSTAHGVLIQPPVQLANGDVFQDKWTLLYVADGACDPACVNALYIARQTRLLLNKDMPRVNRVLLATGPVDRALLERRHPGVLLLDASSPATDGVLRAIPAAQRANGLFIVDPLGNLVMRYDARENPKGLLDDLKKLLKLSHIG
jgi:hypothetical protein